MIEISNIGWKIIWYKPNETAKNSLDIIFVFRECLD